MYNKEIDNRIKKFERKDEEENSEKRLSLLMWLGYTMKLPREVSIPIVEHISEFYMKK